ncbi:MAG: EAL domain-containing protein [Lachnospiraceae bacterium]|nr:EAL domain-containing protein [Lachnospiraceae bacterium]
MMVSTERNNIGKQTKTQVVIRALFLLFLVLSYFFLLPDAAYAQNTGKTVRVGWFDSPFNQIDESGVRSGYAYDYQQRIASYTGWEYEYVEGEWPELMDMLRNGEIDLLSDVSYTPERAEEMLFSSMPMGAEEYYIYILPDNDRFSADDYASFNGARIGVSKGSLQEKFLSEWLEEHGIEAEIVETGDSEYDAERLIRKGELDAYATLDVYGGSIRCIPLYKIGSSDFYFTVNKDRPDLLDELDEALSHIQSENRFYAQKLYEKYFRVTIADLYLTSDERDWLEDHGPIRVGYQDNYLAFCASDENGELTGALKDYLDYASTCIENARLEFIPKAYPSIEDALEALNKGEVDCVFPSNLSVYDGEVMDVLLTDPFIKTEMYAVVRSNDQMAFLNSKDVTAAVNRGNTNYESFLIEHFPKWEKLYCDDTESCLYAVSNGEADCLIISSFRYNNIAALCSQLRLSILSTGVNLDYEFAVNEDDDALFSIMNKVSSLVPSTVVGTSLTYYSAEETKVTFSDFIRDNLATVMAIIAAVTLVILLLVLRSMRAEKKAHERSRLISAVERDELTGLYNKNFFFEYCNRMHQENPEKPMDAVVINIEQFHSVNDLNGWEFGDIVLHTIGEEILAFLEETDGIGSRFEADRFDIFCDPQDDYRALLDRFQGKVSEAFPSASIRLRMGVMPWQADMNPVQLFDRARTANTKLRGTERHLMIYDEAMQMRERLKERLVNDQSHAVRAHEFQVYYQPKFNIQSEPPRLSSAEALIRWQHPDLGMVSPVDFIPLFESTGQICEIDRYVWQEAARQIAEWRDKYGTTLPVSVNLSRVDIQDPTLEGTLDELVSKYGLEREVFKLEVTESAYTENAGQLDEVIRELREKGHEIEMDDFGSGYSSLGMLSSMPVDVLKMDRAFIQNIEYSEKDMRLVELILDIAKNLQVHVVAEGVETEKQMMMLKQAGCELVQGYYFSRPLAPEEFEKRYFFNHKELSDP